MKLRHIWPPPQQPRSLPTRGGWIEIRMGNEDARKSGRPSPHGEGGLKYDVLAVVGQCNRSLPTRGGWIEMILVIHMSTCSGMSLPTRGGWIETSFTVRMGDCTVPGPSPHGEGGLKLRECKLQIGRGTSLPTRGGWIETLDARENLPAVRVPPHTGRVD